jgi:hypothetical protein
MPPAKLPRDSRDRARQHRGERLGGPAGAEQRVREQAVAGQVIGAVGDCSAERIDREPGHQRIRGGDARAARPANRRMSARPGTDR